MYCFSVQRLFLALKDNPTQQALSQVACWCVGEYGDVLVHGSSEEAEPIQVNKSHQRQAEDFYTKQFFNNSVAILSDQCRALASYHFGCHNQLCEISVMPADNCLRCRRIKTSIWIRTIRFFLHHSWSHDPLCHSCESLQAAVLCPSSQGNCIILK